MHAVVAPLCMHPTAALWVEGDDVYVHQATFAWVASA
jgi:hypothetical protein